MQKVTAGLSHRRLAAFVLTLTAGLAAAPATAQEHTVIFEDPGRIIALEGSVCGRSNRDGEEETVRLNGNSRLPAYAARATVFLNGWHTRYLSGDHHVRSISNELKRIRSSVLEAGRKLSWVIEGRLEDKNFDDGYEFCTNYTIIGWSPTWIDAVVDHRAENADTDFNYELPSTVVELDRRGLQEIRNPAFVGRDGAAILPRGTKLQWDNESTYNFISACFDCPADHHVLQLGYFLYQPAPLLGGFVEDIVRWNADGILKDNDARRVVWFGASVSALVGDDVGLIPGRSMDPLAPREDAGPYTGCIVTGGGVETQRFEVANLRFDYALPLLTGVELVYECDDEEVKEIGAWIHDIEYRQPTNGAAGILRYSLSTVLRDQDSHPGHFFAHKVDILGLFAGGPHGSDPLAPP